MEPNTTDNTSKLVLRFTTILRDPFSVNYKLDPINLDPTLFISEDLKLLKSITIATSTSDEAPDLEINSVFELDIDTKSRGYKRIIQEVKLGPPIKDEIFYGLENRHKTLSYGIVKYIAWRNNLHIDQPHTNVKELTMKWEFGGVESDQQPKPQFEITGHYELVRTGVLDLSGTHLQHFYELYDSGLEVPIHQELLTEVNNLMYSSNRRSTYLLLYTALEVATKTLIKTLKPETDYLISKMQSPDLYNLYTQYINTDLSSLVNEEEAKILKNMATVRNNIAHRGEGVTMDILQRHHNFVSSLIKKIDHAMGYV